MPGMSVIRVTDLCTGHVGAQPRPPVAGSMDVLVNGLPVVRGGDLWAPHGVIPHTGVGIGSQTVLVNGLPVMRTSDPITCGSLAGPGSIDVLAG